MKRGEFGASTKTFLIKFEFTIHDQRILFGRTKRNFIRILFTTYANRILTYTHVRELITFKSKVFRSKEQKERIRLLGLGRHFFNQLMYQINDFYLFFITNFNSGDWRLKDTPVLGIEIYEKHFKASRCQSFYHVQAPMYFVKRHIKEDTKYRSIQWKV